MFDSKMNTVVTEDFSCDYPVINEFLFNLPTIQESRVGKTKELLHVKVTINHNPSIGVKRCVGGYGRDMNIFFLLAEALWIWAGRADVKFLTMFNSRMSDYSDDGEVFHAPYGWRLRHYGIPSQDHADAHFLEVEGFGIDQIASVIQMLKGDPNTRRAVMSIWDGRQDLLSSSKDIPCNDLVMLKIRERKGEQALYLSIANRSNDFHWGLPTNLFQFSFIGEMIANVLGIDFVSQTHNIDSLHYYLSNDCAHTIHNKYTEMLLPYHDLYKIAKPIKIDCFNNLDFQSWNVLDRLKILDGVVEEIIQHLQVSSEDAFLLKGDWVEKLKEFSMFFYIVFHLLMVYKEYSLTKRSDEDRLDAINKILVFIDAENIPWGIDIIMMSLNFFVHRIKRAELIPPFLTKIGDL